MKKKLVALLLVLAVVSVGLFAAPVTPTHGDVEFEVKATVSGHNVMKFTSNSMVGQNKSTFEGDTWNGPVLVGADKTIKPSTNTFYDVAFISVMSNWRKGFTISMEATPMWDGTAYIDYSIALNGTDQGSTAGNEALEADQNVQVAEVIKYASGAITGLTFDSRKISIKVLEADYNNAVEGEYTGTVTFTFTANN
jgi:hypothetical protein